MDELERLLHDCLTRADGRVAAVVGRDGLLIESVLAAPDVATASDAVHDLPLVGAEAADLLAAADRLSTEALAATAVEETWLRSADVAVLIRRLQDRSFVVLVVAGGSEPVIAREAMHAVVPGIEAALA